MTAPRVPLTNPDCWNAETVLLERKGNECNSASKILSGVTWFLEGCMNQMNGQENKLSFKQMYSAFG